MTKKDLSEIRQVVKEEINGRVAPVERDIVDLKGDVSQLKGDVKDLKGDVKDLKGDVKDLKGDVKDLKGDFNYLNQKIEQNHREVLAKFDQLITMESEDIAAVQGDVEELKTRVTKLEASRT